MLLFITINLFKVRYIKINISHSLQAFEYLPLQKHDFRILVNVNKSYVIIAAK